MSQLDNDVTVVITNKPDSELYAVFEESNFDVNVGESAALHVSEGMQYIQSGKKEIAEAVDDVKSEITAHADEKKAEFDENAEQKTNNFNENATAKTQDFNANATAKTTDFNNNYIEKKALIDAEVQTAETAATNASNYSAVAKQWAIGDPTEPTGYSAKYWANEAASELSGLTSRISTIEGKIPAEASSSNQLTDKSYVDTADNNLQSQIDAITASSDVTDIVGTYAELQAYDTSSLPNNSIIKVLQDESRDDETTYYRWVITGGVGSWVLIGEEGPYYTKSETDTLLQAKQNEITSSNKLSADLVDDTNSTNKFVTASDINTWNAKQNALTAGTGIDITSDTISNSGVRSVSTGATNGTISVNTNGTSAEVAVYGLGSAAYTASTAYDASGAASTAETNAKNYADSLASNYATAAQGALADTALQSGDNISELNNNAGYITGITSSDVTNALGYTPYDSSNPSGYTDNVGTVTSVNNTSPDSNGNVTLSIPAAQVNSDWNANSGVAQILNKPTLGTMASESASDYTPTSGLATVATSGAYSDLSGTPTVDQTYSGTSTNAQSGTAVASAISTKANDSDVVKLTGNQTVGGTKTFTDDTVISKNSPIHEFVNQGVTKGTNPSSNKESTILFEDKNNNYLGYVFSRIDPSGNSFLRIATDKFSSSTGRCALQISYNSDGKYYAQFSTINSETGDVNYSSSYATSSTSVNYIPTMGWVNNPATSINVVHRTGDETLDGTKKFLKEINGELISYLAYNGSSSSSPYKKIAEFVCTGTNQTVTIPFVYGKMNADANNSAYFGKIGCRTSSTAGTVNATTAGIVLNNVPDFIDNGTFNIYLLYKNNTPASNQVTFQVWIYVKNTYNSMFVLPLRYANSTSNYDIDVGTWGNNMVEAASLPSDYTIINAKKNYLIGTPKWSSKTTITTGDTMTQAGYVVGGASSGNMDFILAINGVNVAGASASHTGSAYGNCIVGVGDVVTFNKGTVYFIPFNNV